MRKPTIILYPNASIRLLVLYAIFSGASVAGVAAAAAPDSGIQEVTVNAATIDKTLDGKQTNNFAFVSANENRRSGRTALCTFRHGRLYCTS